VQTGTDKMRVVEQIKAVVRSGEYARALELLRSVGGEICDDAELSRLEKLAQDGAKRKAEADRLITASQELFAQQKSAEAMQLLRKAYELDKSNSLARTILANALVEHAQSLVETDWLEAEKLSNQALALNPAHPTAKTVLNLIVEKKETSPVEEWASQARKLHSSGDLFAALAWVAEGLAVHPHDPKLLQIQDAVQRDQEARRRQARRGDLDELRRLQQEIAAAVDDAAKQALVGRIQAVAAKHWTDGEILSIANALLLRLGMVPQESSSGSSRRKGATVIFHVPRASAPKAAEAESSKVAESPVPAPAEEAPVAVVPPVKARAVKVPAVTVPAAEVAAVKLAPSAAAVDKVPETAAKEQKATPPVPTPAPVKPSVAVAKVAEPSQAARRTGAKSAMGMVGGAAAIIVLAAVFFFARKNQGPAVTKAPADAPAVSTPAVSAPAVAVPDTSAAASVPNASAPAGSAPAATAPEASETAVGVSSDNAAGKVVAEAQPTAEPGRNVGALVVVAGQDDARVLLNGKLQRQVTRGGQLRVPNLEARDYVVQVAKSGFQDAPQQQVHIRKGEEAKVIFNLQPQARLASLMIQGGAPGTGVYVDQTSVGTVGADGTLSISSVSPGDHTVELRRERFKPRQFKKRFVAGAGVSLTGAEAALDAAGGELKITFSPADAKVALVKGDLLKIVNSGVPLNLDAGTYTLTARTAERFTRSGTVEVVSGQSKTLDLSLAPNGMSKWEDAGGWKREGNAFSRKGGEFVLYGVVPTSGTFAFSAMVTKGHVMQWVLNYTDPRNYVLYQLDENNFYRTVIRNGEKRDEIIVPHKGDKKSFRAVQIRVGATEIVQQVRDGDSWTVLDRWTQPGVNLSAGKFGFLIPGNDQVSVSSFSHYADLNIR